jgi:hypothetical protein
LYLDVVVYLLNRGANVNVRDDNGVTPLHWAAVNGHVNCCRVLISSGAQVNALVHDTDHDTPLDYAYLNNNYECAQYLSDCGGLLAEEILLNAAKIIQRSYRRWRKRVASPTPGQNHAATIIQKCWRRFREVNGGVNVGDDESLDFSKASFSTTVELKPQGNLPHYLPPTTVADLPLSALDDIDDSLTVAMKSSILGTQQIPYSPAIASNFITTSTIASYESQFTTHSSAHSDIEASSSLNNTNNINTKDPDSSRKPRLMSAPSPQVKSGPSVLGEASDRPASTASGSARQASSVVTEPSPAEPVPPVLYIPKRLKSSEDTASSRK